MHDLKGATAEMVLTLICWNERYCQEAIFRLKPEHFNVPAYREIAEIAANFIIEYSKPPRGHLMDLLEHKMRRPNDPAAKLLRLTLDEMERLQGELNAEYVMSELDKFIRKSTLISQIQEADRLVEEGDLAAAAEVMARGAYQNTNRFQEGIWLHKPEQVLKFLDPVEESDQEPFSSGVEALDAKGIRPQRKTLYMFMAPAKAGKSWFLVQVGVESMLRGYRVLHITLENSQELTGVRYVQNICSASTRSTKQSMDIEDDDENIVHITSFKRDEYRHLASELSWDTLQRYKLSPEVREKIESKLKYVVRGKVLIKEFPTGTLTIAELNGYLDYLQRVDNFVPDILILDYIDLLQIDGRNLRVDTGRVTREVRGICVARNMAGVTATQTNRQSLNANVIGGGHVSEDWSKIGTSDIIVSYNQTNRERERSLARLFVVGARGMRDKFLVLISQAYMFGQFCLDSVYFNNAQADKLSPYLEERVETDD